MDMEKRALCIEEMICMLHADAAEKSSANIDTLFDAVNNLLDINHGIEAERLATRLVNIFHQMNGPYHNNSKKASALLEQCKKRYVLILKEGGPMMYQVWIYNNNLDRGIKLGPITETRHVLGFLEQ